MIQSKSPENENLSEGNKWDPSPYTTTLHKTKYQKETEEKLLGQNHLKQSGSIYFFSVLKSTYRNTGMIVGGCMKKILVGQERRKSGRFQENEKIAAFPRSTQYLTNEENLITTKDAKLDRE